MLLVVTCGVPEVRVVKQSDDFIAAEVMNVRLSGDAGYHFQSSSGYGVLLSGDIGGHF